jgi:hypothetical protein
MFNVSVYICKNRILPQNHFKTEYGKSVQITATTGIASLNIGGKTIHSWSGIGDGRYTNNTLLNKLQNNEHYQVYKNNTKSRDCLIIDEISS